MFVSRMAGCLLLVLLALWPARSTFAQELVAGPTPDATGGPLRLRLGFDQASGSLTFFVRNSGTTPINTMVLIGVVSDQAGQVVSNVQSSFSSPGQQIAPGSVVPIVLKLESLPLASGLKATVTAQYGGAVHPLTTVQIDRRPRIVLLGPGQVPSPTQSGTPSIALSTATSAPDFGMTLNNMSSVDVSNVSVVFGSLVRKDGGGGAPGSITLKSDATAQNASISVPAHQVRALTVSANLPQQTSYSGWVGVEYGDDQDRQFDVYALDVARAAPPSSIGIDDIKSVAYDGWFSATTLDVDFIVRETGGLAAQLYFPKLGSLQNGSGNQVTLDVKLQQKVGQAFQDVGGPDNWSLNPHDAHAFRLKVSGLGPGSYSGQLVLSTADGVLVTKNVAITVRDNWVIAFVPTALGVVLAYLVFRWTKGGRAEALRRFDIARQRDAIMATGYQPSTPEAVWDSLLAALNDLDMRNRLGTLSDQDSKAAVQELQKRVELYTQALELDRRIQALLGQYPSSLAAECAERSTRWQTALEGLRASLKSPIQQPIGDPVWTTFNNVYTELRTQILTDLLQFLTRQLAAITDIPDDRRQAVATQLAAIQADITQTQFDAAAAKLTAAWEQVVALGVQQLSADIQQTTEQLRLLADADRVRVTALLDRADAERALAANGTGAARLDHLVLGRHLYLRALLEQLDILVAQARTNGLAGIEDVATKLNSARSAWDLAGEHPTPSQAAAAATQESTAFQVAWSAYLELMAADLRKRIADFISVVCAKPAWLVDPDWEAALANHKTALENISTTLHTPVSWQMYFDARRAFALEATAGLELAAQRLHDHQNNPADASWATRENLLVQLETAVATAHAASQQNPEQPAGLQTLEQAVVAAQNAFAALVTGPRSILEGLDPGAGPPAPVVTQPGPPLRLPVGSLGLDRLPLFGGLFGNATTPKARDSNAIVSLIMGNDLFVIVVFLLVSCVSGISALWLSNATWGAPNDFIAAFFWAFGISATTGTSFNSVAGTLGLPFGGGGGR